MDDPVGQALRSIEASSDSLIEYANNYETRQQILDNPKIINRALLNLQMLASVLEANQPRGFKVVRNG
jgi:hypothetical protein